MPVLINKIRNSIKLSSEAEQYIFYSKKEKGISRRNFNSKRSCCKQVFFYHLGSLRSFYINKEGKEHILQFAILNW